MKGETIEGADGWAVRLDAMLTAARDEWRHVGVATGPADRRAAEGGVADAYRAAGLAPPSLVVWLGSPFAGAIAAWMLAHSADSVRDQVLGPVLGYLPRRFTVDPSTTDPFGPGVEDDGLRLWDGVRARAPGELRISVHPPLRALVRAAALLPLRPRDRRRLLAGVSTTVWWSGNGKLASTLDQVAARVGSRVWEHALDRLQGLVVRQVRAHVRVPRKQQAWLPVLERVEADVIQQMVGQLSRCTLGQHQATLLANLDAHRRVWGDRDNRLPGLMTVARSAGCWWPFRDAVVLTERPAELDRDALGRVHCPTGPAVKYPDGFAVFAWHGVTLPHWAEWAMTNGVTRRDWLRTHNREVRRIIGERLGYR